MPTPAFLRNLCVGLCLFTPALANSQRPRKAVGEYIAENGFYQSIALIDDKPILEKRSQFQDISVVESKSYGKILVLDGVIQLTEKDADSYNEMMTHPAMFSHTKPKRVLVIGGGDGYVLSEVLKHPEVEHVDHVDLDGDVIQICKDQFGWGKAWDDPRVNLHIADGAAFVKNTTEGFYDVIIQDSSDPYTWDEETGERVDLPSKTLYSEDHFQNISRALKENGVFSFQAETFNIESDLEGIVEWRQRALNVGFSDSRYGSITISSYPTGQIGFLLCRKSPSAVPSVKAILDRYERMVLSGNGTSYYQPKLQESVFSLPLWVERRIYPIGDVADINAKTTNLDDAVEVVDWEVAVNSNVFQSTDRVLNMDNSAGTGMPYLTYDTE
eukprot:scaffold2192_cov268-Chaetoceros_neogracile.AAC.41